MGKEQTEKILGLEEEVEELKSENKDLRHEVKRLRSQVKGNLESWMGKLSDQMENVRTQGAKAEAAASLAKTSAERAKLEDQAIPVRTGFIVFAVVTTVQWVYTVDWGRADGPADLLEVLETGAGGRIALTGVVMWVLFEVVHRYMLPAFSGN